MANSSDENPHKGRTRAPEGHLRRTFVPHKRCCIDVCSRTKLPHTSFCSPTCGADGSEQFIRIVIFCSQCPSCKGLKPQPALVGTQCLHIELRLLCKSPGQLLGNTLVCVQDELINCLVSHGNGLHNLIAQLYDVTLVGRGIIHVR